MILKYFKLPEKAIPQMSNNRIPVKQIIEFGGFTGTDKKIIEKSIGMFTINALLNEQTSQIWAYNDDVYRYEEIQFYKVELKQDDYLNELNSLLHGLFPNPCVFIYKFGEKYALSTALKRINKIDVSKSVIEGVQLTNLFRLDDKHIELLMKHSNRFNNLKDYYEFLNNLVATEEVLNLTGIVPEKIDTNSKQLANKIKILMRQKRELELQYKEADSMQEKMSIHMKIKEIDSKLQM